MRSVALPDGTPCSVLGFGCGAVMGRVGRADSLRAMQQALDAGVTLFDTARSYGYGESESVVGEFLAGRRQQVLLTTKFGVQPARRQAWKSLLRPAARTVLQWLPQARRAVRRQAASQIESSTLTPDDLRRSVEQSLGQLRTDYVDFLFLHDIPPAAVQQDDLWGALATLRQEGKVRWFGVSSSLEAAQSAVRQRPEAGAIQMPVNLSNLAHSKGVATEAFQDGTRAVLANNVFGGVEGAASSGKTLQSFATDSTLPAIVRQKIRSLEDQLLPAVMLPLVVRSVGAHCAIVSMMSARNIAANITALEQDPWSDEELAQLLERLTQ
jgi:aryl-alcohol dehydrogenase-like predicted oxidoreductase